MNVSRHIRALTSAGLTLNSPSPTPEPPGTIADVMVPRQVANCREIQTCPMNTLRTPLWWRGDSHCRPGATPKRVFAQRAEFVCREASLCTGGVFGRSRRETLRRLRPTGPQAPKSRVVEGDRASRAKDGKD